MSIYNVIVTTDNEPLVLSLRLANVLANPIPGAWETKGLPVWSSSVPEVVLEPMSNATECKVISPSINSPLTTTITVRADVNIYDSGGYKPMEAKTVVELKPSNQIAGLAALPVGSNCLTYKKID